MLQKKVAEIITKLKKVREEEGISYQRIVELVDVKTVSNARIRHTVTMQAAQCRK